MSTFEISLILFVTSLLVIAVFGIRQRRVQLVGGDGRTTRREGPAQISHAVDPPARAPSKRFTMTSTDALPNVVARIVDFDPPPGSLRIEQLNVGQTINVQTETATYILTLRDADSRRFEAVRVGLTAEETVAEEAFEILFRGSHLPLHGYVHGWFVIGGRMTFLKARAGVVYGFSTSTQVLDISDVIPAQQAS